MLKFNFNSSLQAINFNFNRAIINRDLIIVINTNISHNTDLVKDSMVISYMEVNMGLKTYIGSFDYCINFILFDFHP